MPTSESKESAPTRLQTSNFSGSLRLSLALSLNSLTWVCGQSALQFHRTHVPHASLGFILTLRDSKDWFS